MMFWVPVGFAHGFLTLQNETIFHYKCTNYYNKESEGLIACGDDKRIKNRDWEHKHPTPF